MSSNEITAMFKKVHGVPYKNTGQYVIAHIEHPEHGTVYIGRNGLTNKKIKARRMTPDDAARLHSEYNRIGIRSLYRPGFPEHPHHEALETGGKFGLTPVMGMDRKTIHSLQYDNEGAERTHRAAKGASAREGTVSRAKRMETSRAREAEEQARELNRLANRTLGESVLREDLKKWVKEKWVDIGSPDGKGGYKPCGRSEGDGRKAYPKCVPASKARSMSKKEKKSAVRRKRKAESSSGESKGRSPKMIKTLKEHVTELIGKKLCARGKAAAKRKYDVYPSAYANMYASAVCSGKVTPGGKKDTNESFNSLSEAKKKRITKLHSKKYPKGTHYCATHVEHVDLGIGTTITEHHAKPDKYGDIDWYDVKFVDHGIVEQVPTDHVNILLGEMHENHEHHEHEENELTEEFAKVKAPAGHHWMKQGKNEYTLMPHKGKFKPHKNGSLEAEFEIQKVHKS